MVSLEENFSLAGVSHVWTWASESYVVRFVTPSGGTTNHLSSQPTTLAARPPLFPGYEAMSASVSINANTITLGKQYD